jgi:hypothetical protein
VTRLEREGRVLWRKKMTAHHDAELRPDGKLAVLTFARHRIPGIHPEVDTRDDQVTLLDPDTGEVVGGFGFLDAVAGREAVFPPQAVGVSDQGGAPWVDLFHSNALEWMREEELFGTHPLYSRQHVLVTFRNQDRIAIFDAAFATVIWSWGGKDLDGPHDAQLLPSGNILLFDNGLARGWSRAVEVDPRTRTIVWSWEAHPRLSFSTASKGSVQRLPNGNTLLAESDRGRAIEVSPSGDVVWEFLCPHRVGTGERAAIVRMRWVDQTKVDLWLQKVASSRGLSRRSRKRYSCWWRGSPLHDSPG